ncbi:hypothetical protein CTRI78_v008296 [Colletotrichum trifolii]|uniref:Uncharacterized protein n=1 Tax=Colletotrichum trifolii TaxID=5466 RepID=A0A4R8QXU2_COLTR|nr:hypothetical protein CTRI78_v008296 [Colletotrichum trifolii]
MQPACGGQPFVKNSIRHRVNAIHKSTQSHLRDSALKIHHSTSTRKNAKHIVLRLGEDIKYNNDYYESIFTDRFTVVVNEEPDRASFIAALKSKKYGDFSAIFRPHFQSGGEMGQWDDELIPLLPPSIRILASAGAGFN